MLKRVFKKNVILYLLWYLINKNKLSFRLPIPKDNLYFDGFPRSGNTYTLGLFKYIFEFQNTSHLHSIVGFKIAQFFNISSIVIVRNPMDAISSLLYTKMNRSKNPIKDELKNLISELTLEYCLYYEFILKNKNIYIIDFKEFISDSRRIILEFERLFNFKRKSPSDISNSISLYLDLMSKKESKKEITSSSLPNEDRLNFKIRISGYIEEDKQYERAQNIYENLKRKSL